MRSEASERKSAPQSQASATVPKKGKIDWLTAKSSPCNQSLITPCSGVEGSRRMAACAMISSTSVCDKNGYRSGWAFGPQTCLWCFQTCVDVNCQLAYSGQEKRETHELLVFRRAEEEADPVGRARLASLRRRRAAYAALGLLSRHPVEFLSEQRQSRSTSEREKGKRRRAIRAKEGDEAVKGRPEDHRPGKPESGRRQSRSQHQIRAR